MLWVTRQHIRVNRAATGWLVRRFVDPDAQFYFVPPPEVTRIQAAEGAVGFDAPGARYPHKDGAGRCSFEALVEEYRPDDGALKELARIVHRADFPEEACRRRSHHAALALGTFDAVSLRMGRSAHSDSRATAPEAMGLRTIAQGFPLVATDDQDTLTRSAFIYDALYASLRERLGG